MSQTWPIPPTGRITLSLDWADDLQQPPRCGATLVSASWTMPVGVTLVQSTVEGSKVIFTITTNNLKINGTVNLICSATLSNGDILPAAVACVAVYRTTRRSTEVCPTP